MVHGNASGRYFIESKKGGGWAWIKWNMKEGDKGIVEVTGRVAAGSNAMWMVDVFNQKTKRGVSVRVHYDGHVEYKHSLFQKEERLESKLIKELGPNVTTDFHNLAVAVHRRRLRVFWDGEPIGDELRVDFDLTPGVVLLGIADKGRVEFERMAFWRTAGGGTKTNTDPE